MALALNFWRIHEPSGDGRALGKLDERRRILWFRWFLLYPRMCIAAAGYAVLGIFALGYGVASFIGVPIGRAAIVGVLAVAPVVVAVIGERVTGIKAFGVELTLAEVTPPIAGDQTGVAANLSDSVGQGESDIDPSHVDPALIGSSTPALSGPMEDLVRTQSKLLRIDLRNDAYWWSTRLFLVAALTQDYTDVEALVFVRSRGDEIFVGIASPRDVRKRLARTFPSDNYEAAYRQARGDAASDTIGPANKIAAILEKWPTAIGNPDEESIAKIVSSIDLRRWLQKDLDTHSVPSGPLTAQKRYRIISQPRRYVALTKGERLDEVVDRDEVIVAAQMERRFGSGI